jgi:methyl-accepting chemotaxis protein
VNKIGSCVKGEIKLAAAELPDYRTCRFGKGYYSEGQRLCAGLSSFRAIESPHERIHREAVEAVSAANSGDRGSAGRHYREIVELSGKINGLLEEIKRESHQHQRGRDKRTRGA